ncbi:hypothetical protein ID875_25530 [Streptomyces globisporus]|uniref:Uncharacterized protein n=1 Tax=Streptomyces globisporus TaxID=1908 RepID=A0A927BNJ3_STRGL|nr:hypothetical protein [Streptomyces globisporus]
MLHPRTAETGASTSLARSGPCGAGNNVLAARIGTQAVGIATETGSARIVHQLDRLDQALAPAASENCVAEFRASLDRIVLRPA